MADREQRLSIVVTAQDLASGKLGKVRSELAQMGRGGQIAAVGLGTGIKAAHTAEGAFRHLGGVVSGLAGPIGLIGVSGAVFGLTGALEAGIGKAQTMGFAVEKLTGLTGESASAMSGLDVLFEKFGLDAAVTSQIVGFTEKSLGKLDQTTVKAGASAADHAKAQDAVTKAHENLTLAEEKLRETENKKKVTTSQLTAARFKVRDATAALTIAEQKLAGVQDAGTVSVSKAEAIQKKYGVALLNAKGQALPFSTILGNVADYYNSNAQASDKAYVAATLFGRGYARMIPILKLGSKGIADAEQAAKDLGLTLSDQNVADLAKYREAVRGAGEAVSGLELQFGLMIMPDLTTGLKSLTTFVATHREEIQGFFRDGLHGAEALAGFITGTVVPTMQGLTTTARGFWDSIPPEFRDILVKGFIADRTINFLFGLSPGKLVLSLAGDVIGPVISKGLGGLFGNFAQRGSSPANPMFVAGAGVGGIGGPVSEGGGAISGAMSLLSKALLVGFVAEAAMQFHDLIKAPPDIPASQLSWPWGPKDTPTLLPELFGGNGFLGGNPNTQPNTGINPAGGVGAEPYGPSPAIRGTFPGKAADDLALAVRGNTAAISANTGAVKKTFKPPDSATAQAQYRASRALMGDHRLNVDPAKDTSITRRLTYIGGAHKGGDVVTAVNALATHFERTNLPVYKNMNNLLKTIKVDTAAQRGFLARGDTKTAHALGLDIARLKAELGRRTDATTRAILNKNMTAVLNAVINTTVNLSSRAITSATAVDQIRSHAGNGGA